jgi:regulator of protease activity HflC (stomatin/prohibitin superfamily)
MNPAPSTQQPADDAINLIEQSLQITPFHVEQVPTLDGVPVNVEAVVCWHMPHAREAKTSLAGSQQAIGDIVQTILGSRIPESTLAALLSEPGAVGAQLCQGIGEQVARWGAVVHAVDIQGVSLPEDMDADNDRRLLLEMTLRRSRHRLDCVTEAIRSQLDFAAQTPLASQTSAVPMPSP